MFAKTLLACSMLCLSAVELTAQPTPMLRSRAVPAQADSAFERMQAREAARGADIRKRWLASGHALEPGNGPMVLSGKLLTPSLTVGKENGAPEYSVRFKTGPSGLYEIDAYFYPPGPGDSLYVEYAEPLTPQPVTKGTVTIRVTGDGYGYGAFNTYSPPGTWTLSYLYIYDNAGHRTYYQPSQVAALFPSVTLQLANPDKADTTAPMITAGKVLTPVVKLGSTPAVFQASLAVSDDVSGVRTGYMYLRPPKGDGIGQTTYVSAPLKSGKVTTYVYLGTAPVKGTWTIGEYQACDVARNCFSDSDATDIKSLFGTTTFTVK